ncbi:Site-specific recombinase XerD [Maribacter sedimenticola]|uniref:Site-specific recombinase XerD n=1 Tax=Maribacter sedimenticola TaxID=228956 RepID=A0ABY1SM80_9FLAO|nr:site-specific integrase [Maribacter sedimenticola]SNR80481.1 Site-specific recombinase XerD [Maribacter sedimenticola]
MSIFQETVTFEHESEHVLEHDLSAKSNFSTPKIYTAKGDLTKRWYVYFSFRDPITKKLVRMKNIYGKANKYKTKADRLTILTAYRNNLLKLLKQGYSPFENNESIKRKISENKFIESKNQYEADIKTNNFINQKKQNIAMPIGEAFEFVMKLKQNQVKPRTIQDYRLKTKAFLKWLSSNHPHISTIDQLTKKVLLEFLNEKVMSTSARNRNNFRLTLGTILQTLEENEIISFNFIKTIKVLKSIPNRNKTFTQEIEKRIFKHLEKEDPILLLYIKFVAYNFLRPIEASRLKIKDVDIQNRTLTFQAKNSNLKRKTIPQILLEELPDLTNKNPEHLLFTPNTIGGIWNTKETNRRNYFSKRFKQKVKNHFNLNEDFGLYSFRHTYITKLYRRILRDATPFEAKSKLMLITGHNSMSALEKYLRDIDAELAQDYSNLLKE